MAKDSALFYDALAPGYDALYGAEQRAKVDAARALLSVTPGMTLLDVGCGTGISTEWPCRCVGVDASLHSLLLARRRHPRALFVHAVMERLPFGDRAFDVVVALTSLQNARDVPSALAEMRRAGRGALLVSFPARLDRAADLARLVMGAWPDAHEVDLAGDIAFWVK